MAFAGHHNDRVLFGQDDGILPKGAVTPEGLMLAAPELVTVTLEPVVRLFGPRWFCGIGLLNLERGGFPHPFGGQELLAVPLALLQVELAELRQAFGRDAQTPATRIDAERTGLPGHARDAKGLKQLRSQVVDDFLAGDLGDDG